MVSSPDHPPRFLTLAPPARDGASVLDSDDATETPDLDISNPGKRKPQHRDDVVTYHRSCRVRSIKLRHQDDDLPWLDGILDASQAEQGNYCPQEQRQPPYVPTDAPEAGNWSVSGRHVQLRRPSLAQTIARAGSARQGKHYANRGSSKRGTCAMRCWLTGRPSGQYRSEEHTSELQSQSNLVCRLLLEKKNKQHNARCLARQEGSNLRRGHIPALPELAWRYQDARSQPSAR